MWSATRRLLNCDATIAVSVEMIADCFALSFSRQIANFTRLLVSARRVPSFHNQVSITQPNRFEWNRPYQGTGCGTDGSIPGAQVDGGKGVGCDSGRAIPLQKKEP